MVDDAVHSDGAVVGWVELSISLSNLRAVADAEEVQSAFIESNAQCFDVSGDREGVNVVKQRAGHVCTALPDSSVGGDHVVVFLF